MQKRMNLIMGLCTGAAVLALAACGSAPTATAVPPTAVPATVAPAATTAPTATTAPAAATATTAPAAATATTAPAAATATTAAATATTAAVAAVEPDANSAKPSNEGGVGPALALTGDAKSGAKIYLDNCKKCHGDEGKGGISNPGSTDGTIPEINPIDDTIVNKDVKVFAANIDLFIEHGSTPEGKSPKDKMTAFGDEKKLTPQQIADVIAYVISLNSK